MEMSVNNFDVLKQMGERNLNVTLSETLKEK